MLELPPSDSGHDRLPEISGGEDMFKTPAKRARRTSGVAAGSRGPGDLQLPAEVVNADLDDMFDDVLSSPDNRTHKFVNVQRSKGRTMKKWYLGPSSQEVMKRLFRSELPSVTPKCAPPAGWRAAGRCLRDLLTPTHLEHTKKLGLRGELSADLATGWD